VSPVTSHVRRDELASLVMDPIIMDLAKQMRGDAFTPDEARTWEWIRAIGDEYRRRGGTRALTVGGPAYAVALLLEAWT
jgi:hypothetical protein